MPLQKGGEGGLRGRTSRRGMGNWRINNWHRRGRGGGCIVIGGSRRGRLIGCCYGVLQPCHRGWC